MTGLQELGFNQRLQEPTDERKASKRLNWVLRFVTVTFGTDGSPAMAVVSKPPCGCQWHVVCGGGAAPGASLHNNMNE